MTKTIHKFEEDVFIEMKGSSSKRILFNFNGGGNLHRKNPSRRKQNDIKRHSNAALMIAGALPDSLNVDTVTAAEAAKNGDRKKGIEKASPFKMGHPVQKEMLVLKTVSPVKKGTLFPSQNRSYKQENPVLEIGAFLFVNDRLLPEETRSGSGRMIRRGGS